MKKTPESIKFSLRFGAGRGKRVFELIYELLPEGKKNAIAKETLCDQLGINPRILRKKIMRERQLRSGYILSIGLTSPGM